MAWQYVSRKGGGKGRTNGVQDQLLQSMTAMQNSISQLAQSICTKPPPGSKGQGKGRPPKGQGKGVKTSPGERKSPNLKPEEERAEPTTEEVKCPRCPNTYNWTTRAVCRSCGCKLPQGNVPKSPTSQKSAGPANAKTGGSVSSSGGSSGTYASVVKGEVGPADSPKEEKGTQQKKVESIEKLLATIAKDDPLREDLESQLEQLRAALKDPRNPGARLDSAMAKMRKAKAKVEKCPQEQLRQAEASLKAAHAEEEEANSELKAAQENAVPKSELPPGDAAMQLSSEDTSDLTDMLKQCGLLAVAACEDASEAQAKKLGQSGTLRQPPQNSPGDCKAGEPSSRCETGKQRAYSSGCGEEWWGWVLGGNTTWGSRGPPRALQPPTPKSRRTSESANAPDPARRKGTQRDHERLRNPEPAQCTDAGLADVARGFLPGRPLQFPMGWGVGDELTKS